MNDVQKLLQLYHIFSNICFAQKDVDAFDANTTFEKINFSVEYIDGTYQVTYFNRGNIFIILENDSPFTMSVTLKDKTDYLHVLYISNCNNLDMIVSGYWVAHIIKMLEDIIGIIGTHRQTLEDIEKEKKEKVYNHFSKLFENKP